MRLWWQGLTRNEKIAILTPTIGALVALLVGIIGSTPDYLGLLREGKQAFAPSPDLKISAFSVARQSEIEEDFFDGGVKTGRGRTDVTQFDVTVTNAGKRKSLITAAEFRVRRVLHLKDLKECPEGAGGPLSSSAHYSVKLPGDPPKVPFTLNRKIRFEVKPDAIERFTIQLGPAAYGEQDQPWLINAELVLYHDGREKPLVVGAASLVEPSTETEIDSVFSKPLGATYANCLMAVATAIEEFVKLPGSESSPLALLAARANAFRGPDLEPAKQVCSRELEQGPQKSLRFGEMCATYTQRVLHIQVKTTGKANLLKPRNAILSIMIQPSHGPVYEFITALDPSGAQACLNVADRDDWNGDCTNSDSRWSSKRIDALIWTEKFRKYKEVAVYAYLYDRSGKFVDEIPDASDVLSVVRGR